ncbi:MAG: hypothetical protein ACD_75C02490G0009 [uncultured bacterium]|nr:MAG: hypothetical protein ACD_75C02490G0009 [uncultured bacterium]
MARFRSEIADLLKAESPAIEAGRLQGVTDNEFDVVDPLDG